MKEQGGKFIVRIVHGPKKGLKMRNRESDKKTAAFHNAAASLVNLMCIEEV